MNPLFMPILAGTLVFFFAGIWFTRKARTKIQRLSLVAIFLVAATPALLFAVYYTGFMGEAGWFYSFRSWPSQSFLHVVSACWLVGFKQTQPESTY